MLRACGARRWFSIRSFSVSAALRSHGLALPTPPPHEEVRIKLAGLEIAGLSFGDPSSPRKLLGAHGWMDNAKTHSHTASAWTSQGFHFISLDLPGHGQSGHRALADSYAAGGYAMAVAEAARSLGWSSFALCAHSMGAGISSMVAGALGEQVTALCVLEGIGMNTKAESLSASGLRQAVEGRASLLARAGKQKMYPSRKDAALARVATVRRYPGNQHISWHAATTLVDRGTVEVGHDGAGAGSGSVRFSHDSRLMEPSSTYLSEAQMLDYLKRVSAPTLCVTSTGGWPWPAGVMLGRIASVPDMEHHHVLGGHHAHLDDDHGAQLFNAIIADWVRRRLPDIDARIEAAAAKARAKHSHGHGHGHSHGHAKPSSDAGGQRHGSASGSGPEPAAAAAARPVYHPAGVSVEATSGSSTPAASTAHVTAAAASVGAGLRKVNPTAGAGEDVEAEADVVSAAQSIASSATVNPADSASNASNSGSGAAASVAGQQRAGSGPAHALFTDKHVFVAQSAPFSPADIPSQEAAASGSQLRVHGYDTVLRVVKANAASPALYTWPTGDVKSGGYAPLPKSGEQPASQKERTSLTWTRLPDHLVGLPHARTLRNNGGPAFAGLQLGAWAPRIFLETMPTLEAVTVAAAVAQGGTDGAHAALEANTKALEARGSSY